LSEVIELLVYTSENIGTHDDLKTSLVTSWKKGQKNILYLEELRGRNIIAKKEHSARQQIRLTV
jgi:hypothetical protein